MRHKPIINDPDATPFPMCHNESLAVLFVHVSIFLGLTISSPGAGFIGDPVESLVIRRIICLCLFSGATLLYIQSETQRRGFCLLFRTNH